MRDAEALGERYFWEPPDEDVRRRRSDRCVVVMDLTDVWSRTEPQREILPEPVEDENLRKPPSLKPFEPATSRACVVLVRGLLAHLRGLPGRQGGGAGARAGPDAPDGRGAGGRRADALPRGRA